MGSRMFVAVLPPERVIDDLADFTAPRRGADDNLRWTRPDDWHLTTAFMESVDAFRVDSLSDNLAEVAARTEAFALRIAGTRCFPDVGRARVLAVDVADGSDDLTALALRCRTAAMRAGVWVDGTRFAGHLTLARTRRAADLTRWLRVVDSWIGARWTVNEIALVESHLADRGNRHEIVGRYRLGGERS